MLIPRLEESQPAPLLRDAPKASTVEAICGADRVVVPWVIRVAVMDAAPDTLAPQARLAVWEGEPGEQLERASAMFAEVNSLERDDMASLSVALRLLRSIVRH